MGKMMDLYSREERGGNTNPFLLISCAAVYHWIFLHCTLLARGKCRLTCAADMSKGNKIKLHAGHMLAQQNR